MRNFLLFFRRLHLWLLANLAALALFALARTQRGVMNAVSEGFSMPLERALGRLWGLVPFSGVELCYVLAAVFLVYYLISAIVGIVRAEYKAEVAYRRALLLVNLLLSLYAAFCLLWGVNFYADDFCDKSGVYPAPVAYEDLVSVTRLFAEQTAAHAGGVARNPDGTYAVPRQETLALAPTLYEGICEDFPFLYLPVDPQPKPVVFSRVLSAMNVTGVYSPFTGESNLNMDFPAAAFPFTVAHELAHRRGIASEQQCNFLGALASIRSDDPAYQYSGWLTGYIHLSNALFTVNIDAWADTHALLPPEAEADLRAANVYWGQFSGPVSRASGKVYDAMLKSYGDELGMKSYGAVVDLLVAYFK